MAANGTMYFVITCTRYSLSSVVSLSVWLLLVLQSVPRGKSFFIPATTANDFRIRWISIPDFIHYIFIVSLFLRKSKYFPFEYSVLNKGTPGTIFVTFLVWRGPWLGIETGTSHTQYQHSTTRLSRRRSQSSTCIIIF